MRAGGGKGRLLARLSNEMAASTYRDTVNKALEAAASIIRLDAELTDKLRPILPISVRIS